MRKVSVISALCLFLLTACGGQVKFSKGDGAREEIVAKHYKFNSVGIVYSDKAKLKLKKYPGYKENVLVTTVSDYFRKQGLISSKSNYVLEFHVNDIFLRSRVKAFLLPISDPDKIEATVRVKNSSGEVVETFKVDSSYSLGGTTSLVVWVRTRYLFSNLSQLVSDVFTGKKRESDF